MTLSIKNDKIAVMFLFWRIILAHILGDFPLQTDTIYHLKVRSRLGGLAHGAVFIILNLLLGWPYLGNKLILAYLIGIGLIHAVIDRMKISFKGRYTQGETIITFLSDQFVHIALIALVIPMTTRLAPLTILSPRGLAGLYYNNKFIFFAIAYSFVSYGGFIFSAAFKNTFSKSTISVSSIPEFQKRYGFVERILITLLIMTWSPLLTIVIAAAPRLIPSLNKKTGGWGDFFINYCLALIIGLILRNII